MAIAIMPDVRPTLVGTLQNGCVRGLACCRSVDHDDLAGDEVGVLGTEEGGDAGRSEEALAAAIAQGSFKLPVPFDVVVGVDADFGGRFGCGEIFWQCDDYSE